MDRVDFIFMEDFNWILKLKGSVFKFKGCFVFGWWNGIRNYIVFLKKLGI